jgi:hypothetical protein
MALVITGITEIESCSFCRFIVAELVQPLASVMVRVRVYEPQVLPATTVTVCAFDDPDIEPPPLITQL